jgi:transposase
MRRVTQAVLPLLPAAAVSIGPVAGLAEGPEGGVVFVAGMARFAFDAGDEVGRRLAAVQLVATKIASAVSVAEGFGVSVETLWRWRCSFAAHGVSGLIAGKTGPKGPHKLTEQIIARARELDEWGWGLATVAAEVGISVSTVRVALGRVSATARGQESDDVPEPAQAQHCEVGSPGRHGLGGGEGDEPGAALAVVPMPTPRAGERVLARAGELVEAPVVFTEAPICRWPGCC